MSTPTDLQPGDFILTGVKEQGIISRAIKLGALLRGYPSWARRFSHTALVVSTNGTLVEAQKTGTRFTHISRFSDGDYVLVKTGCSAADQEQIKDFAWAVVQSKQSYGFVTFLGLAIYCLTGASLCIQRAGTSICSGFVCDALTRAGFIWERPPYAMMPADLAVHFDVRT